MVAGLGVPIFRVITVVQIIKVLALCHAACPFDAANFGNVYSHNLMMSL